MLDILHDYLNRAATPEEKLLLANALESLENVGLENYEHAIEEIILMEDEVDSDATLDALKKLVRALQYQVLSMHSLQVSEEASMSFITDLIDGIMLIQNYENHGEIQQILSLDITVRERFCELMQIVTNHSVDELLLYIEHVPPGLLQRLHEQEEHEESIETEESIALRNAQIARFRAYETYLPEGAPAKIRALLAAGVGVGHPYALYAGTVGNGFEQLQVDEIAEEMFGMAIISSDGAERPATVIKQHIEEYIANPETITAVMARVHQLVTGFKA